MARQFTATKKIGKNNPKAQEIEADNQKRQEWNRSVDMALISGVSEPQIMEVKRKEIYEPIKKAVAQHGRKPKLFAMLVIVAIEALELLIVTVLTKKAKEASDQQEEAIQADTTETEIKEMEEACFRFFPEFCHSLCKFPDTSLPVEVQP